MSVASGPHTRFPGGSAAALRETGDEVRFAAVRHEAPVSMWWHFALEGGGLPRRCVWEQTNEVLGWTQLPDAVPVYRGPGRPWRRVDPRSCHHDADRHEFRFTVPAVAGPVEVAYCYPFGLGEVAAWLAELERQAGVAVRVLTRSAGGRPFFLVEFGAGTRHVWLTARHHAGEVQGTWVMAGLIRAALASPRLLAAVTFHAAPVMDVDGVAAGWYGKDRGPRDFNRDYVTRPCRPEVAALMAAAEAVGQADVMLDLHGPAPGDPSFLVPPPEPTLSVEEWRTLWTFGARLQALAPRRCPVRVRDWSPSSLNWSGIHTGQTATAWFHQRFGALAATLETTYHRSHDERLVTAADWLALGRSLAACLEVHCGLRPSPDTSAIALPPTTLPRFRHWRCVTWPQRVTLREEGTRLTLHGDAAGGTAWMLSQRTQAGRRVAFRARLTGALGRLVVTARGVDPRSGLSTGTLRESRVPLRAAPATQHLTVPTPEAHSQLFFQAENLCGTLTLAVE